MKTRRVLPWLLILPLAAGVAVLFGYRIWAHRVKTPVIRVERDQSDIPTLAGSGTMGVYDPYFNRVNSFNPSKVVLGTNQLSGITK
jgi:hypothetical protein